MSAMDKPATNFSAIGWPADQSMQLALQPWPDGRLARVVAQHRSGYELAQDPEHTFRAQAPAAWLRPRTDPLIRAVVGDWVVLDAMQKQILAVLPRYALLKRAAAGEHYQQQLIAANIDHVLLVSGMDEDFNAKRIERYFLLIQSSGAKPVLVLTKLDRCDDPDVFTGQLGELTANGVPVFTLNAKDPQHAAILHVRAGADADWLVVATDDGVEPDTGIVFEDDVADDHGIGRDPGITAGGELNPLVVEGENRHLFCHPHASSRSISRIAICN